MKRYFTTSRNFVSLGLSAGLAGMLSACSGGSSSSSPVSPPPPPAVTIKSADGTSQISVQASAGTVTTTRAMAPPAAAPNSNAYPLGYFGYSITGLTKGQSVTVTIQLPSGVSPTDYVKCDTGLTTCSAVAGSLVKVAGNTLPLTLTAGGSGDEAGTVDGTIVDPGAPAIKLPAATAAYLIPYEYGAGSQNDGIYAVPSDNPTATPRRVFASNGADYFALSIEKALTDASGNIYQTVASTAVIAGVSQQGGQTGELLNQMDLSNTSGSPSIAQV